MCVVFSVEDYCDQRGSLSTQPNPITRRCECKVNSCSISLQLAHMKFILTTYSKTSLKQLLKNRQNKDPNDKWYFNEGQKYCRMLPLEHSAILLTCIKQ